MLLIACVLPAPAGAQGTGSKSEPKSSRKAVKASSASGGSKDSTASKGASAASEPMSVMDEKATATFKEGLAAFDRRDFEAARVAFLQTFALKPAVPVVRRNLGLSEIYSGHYLEGARRLARVLHTTDEGTAEDRARMQESLKKAEAHLERVSIEVRQEGAEISIDGVDLGASPLPFLWYVAPGQYDVRVTKPGFVAHRESRVARAGVAQHLVVALAPERQEPPPRPALPPPIEPQQPTGPNGWVLLGGGVLTAGALTAGAVFSIAAESNEEKVEQLNVEFGTGYSCPTSMPMSCEALKEAAETHDRQQRYALASFVVAGAAGVATLLYAIFGGSDGDEPGEDPVAGGTLAAGWARSGPYVWWNGSF